MAEVEVWYVHDASNVGQDAHVFCRSLQLEGGAEEAITPPADIRLTNISFGEDLADPNGRSVIKLGYNAITADDLEEDEDEDEEEPKGTYTTTILAPLTAGKVRHPNFQ